jgi:ubiquinone/menaquinone biosynthesis C-methylase UbiE
MLEEFPAGSWVLDAPCGTGRFFSAYEKNRFVVRGVDISPDMLREAGKKIKDPLAMIDGEKQWGWRIANIIEDGFGLDDSSVDVSVCCRFTRWVIQQYGPEGITKLLHELQRVTRSAIIITVRVENHPFAVSLDLVKDALLPEWCIHEDAEGYEPAYRILKIGPAA